MAEIMHGLHQQHECDATELGTQRMPVARLPEGAIEQRGRVQKATEIEVAETRRNQHADADPAHQPELLPEGPKQLGAQLRRLYFAQHRRTDHRQKQHAAQPDQGCQHMQRDVQVKHLSILRYPRPQAPFIAGVGRPQS